MEKEETRFPGVLAQPGRQGDRKVEGKADRVKQKSRYSLISGGEEDGTTIQGDAGGERKKKEEK